jgi:enamine deaminase RidA (YjgF/YER057c/UK114 family)
MGTPRGAVSRLAAVAALATVALASQRGEKEPVDQTLRLPPELPQAVTGATSRLTFLATPLSAKGLLTQQTRDSLKALTRAAGGATILHVRAFVAGTGDIRRVRDLVSEAFAEKSKPLPALSVIRIGALPVTGAQVALEAVAAGKKSVNPHGLAFLSAQEETSADRLDPVLPLARRSLASLESRLAAAGAEPADVLRLTCYFSSLEEVVAIRSLAAAQFPRAALSIVQPQRAAGRALAACEAVARLRRPLGVPLRVLESAGSTAEYAMSPSALVAAPSLVITGMQASFGFEEKDADLAVERLKAALSKAGAASGGIVSTRWYSLAPAISTQLRARMPAWLGTARPAATLLLFEGLSSMDAGFAVDAIAVKD